MNALRKEATLADLLVETVKAVLCAALGIIAIYIVTRIVTMAVLRSIYEFRKQVAAKEG